jgi:hypothetical protein
MIVSPFLVHKASKELHFPGKQTVSIESVKYHNPMLKPHMRYCHSIIT